MPEARKSWLIAQLVIGKSQLLVERRAGVAIGKLMEAAQPRPAPLEYVAEARTVGCTGPKATFDPGVLNQCFNLTARYPAVVNHRAISARTWLGREDASRARMA